MLAVVRPLREARENAATPRTLLVCGVMADVLARELAAGGDGSVVRVGRELGDSDAVVLVLSGPPTPGDVELLRRARGSGSAAVVVQLQPGVEGEIPYVLATDVLAVPAGAGFPVDAVARALARRMGERVVPLGAALPRLRAAVARELAHEAAKKNAFVALSPWAPQFHLYTMLANEARLAYDTAALYQRGSGSTRLPEGLLVGGIAFGLRALARRAVYHVPVGQRITRTAVAYAGTIAIGELVRRRARLGV